MRSFAPAPGFAGAPFVAVSHRNPAPVSGGMTAGPLNHPIARGPITHRLTHHQKSPD